MSKVYLSWNESDFVWSQNDYTWDDVAIVTEVLNGGSIPYENYLNFSKEKKEKFITLIFKIKDQKIIQKKVLKKYKVTVKDIDLVISKVLGPKINLEK